MKIHLISLGCPKNLVDSETLTGLLIKNRHTFVPDIKNTDAIILNTCAFIGQARNESRNYIKSIASSFKKYKKPLFIVTGCLPQIEQNLLNQFSEIDAVFGSADFVKIPDFLETAMSEDKMNISYPSFIYSSSYLRAISTGSYAYLKIAEGCNNRCSYCLIPAIRGDYREREIKDIVIEARKIAESGIKEIILVSQDTTFYGMQIYGKKMLHRLIEELAKIRTLKWIRLLYTHPGHFTDELIDTIAKTDKVCKYIDIPIQHTHDEILKKMNRPQAKTIFDTIEKLRNKMPDITLRSTVIVGYPGETEKHFNCLLKDLSSLEFDWLGAFKYSRQKNTKAYYQDNHIPCKIKNHRLSEVMAIQQKITFERNLTRIGKEYEINADNECYGHCEFQAPEIDGKIFLNEGVPNKIQKVLITGVKKVYDLEGRCVPTN